MKHLKFITLLFYLVFFDRPINRNTKRKQNNYYTYFAKSPTWERNIFTTYAIILHTKTYEAAILVYQQLPFAVTSREIVHENLTNPVLCVYNAGKWKTISDIN
jgi:hypothetical protein